MTRFKELFMNKKFFHYTWIGIFVSLLNVAMLWVAIDLMHINTILASTGVVVFNFLLRYVLFDWFKIV